MPIQTTNHASEIGGSDALPMPMRRGRGAVSNRTGRFEARKVVPDRESWPDKDSWNDSDQLEPAKTLVVDEYARTIITRNNSPDVSFDRSINPYRGCEHGCVYCFARPTHAYSGLSAGIDFETRLFAKPNAATLLRRELSRPNYVPQTIAIGTNTDPYQPIERRYRLMREILTVLSEFNNPVAIVTKSASVTRDLDILAPMAKRGLAKVALSVTTLDHRLARKMEPRASTPRRRLDALRLLAESGVPTAVMVAPVIPALNDAEMEKILKAATQVGVQEAGYILLRLPLEVKELFREWLDIHFPDRAEHVMNLVRETRGGKEYDSQWGKRMTGKGPYAWMIGRRFELAAKRLGLNLDPHKLRTDLFAVPGRACQLSLL